MASLLCISTACLLTLSVIYGDAALARSFLTPIKEHLIDACFGSISEIFDGDPPHEARGCFAQAWSIAEVLRAWQEIGP